MTDEDRQPWLQTLHGLLLGWYESGISGILSCSALKQSYREMLSAQIPPVNLRFILLNVSTALLETRLKGRRNHYMNPELLRSQLDALEVTPDLVRVDAEGPSAEDRAGDPRPDADSGRQNYRLELVTLRLCSVFFPFTQKRRVAWSSTHR